MASAANARSVGHRQSTQRRRELHQRVMRTLNSGRAHKGKVGEPSDFRSGRFPEAGRTVDTCADRGTAEGELGPAAPAQSVHDCQRASPHRRVLHVGAADLQSRGYLIGESLDK